MCSLFLMIALFITANTVRLAFYARQTEVEIMRLVGATSMDLSKPPFIWKEFCRVFSAGLWES